MRFDQRIVTTIPLTEIWDDSGTLTSERIRYLDQTTLRELAESDSVLFIVADCGLKLEWIPIEKRFELWKRVKSQIADPVKPIHREDFPNETAYVVSEWHGRSGEHLILLEKHH